MTSILPRPQGCVLSSLLYNFYTHDCMAAPSRVCWHEAFICGTPAAQQEEPFRRNPEINTTQKIISCSLSSLKNFFSSHCLNGAANIWKDPHHPGHHQYELLPSGTHFRSIISRTKSEYCQTLTLTLSGCTNHCSHCHSGLQFLQALYHINCTFTTPYKVCNATTTPYTLYYQ